MAPFYAAITDLDHDPKLANALGNMVVVWSHAELMMVCAFARIANLGLNMAAESYYRIPTFESRAKFTLALLGRWESSEFDPDAISVAVVKLAKLASTRNHWVHGGWGANPELTRTAIFDSRAKPGSAARRKPVKAADVEQHCEAVKKRANALGTLIKWWEMSG